METYLLSAPEGFVYAVDSLNELFLETGEKHFENFLNESISDLTILPKRKSELRFQNGKGASVQAIRFLVGALGSINKKYGQSMLEQILDINMNHIQNKEPICCALNKSNQPNYVYPSKAKYRLQDEKAFAGLLRDTTDLRADVADLVARVLVASNRINENLSNVPRIGKLVDFDWKLSVALETSECEELSIPYITLMLHIENTKGEVGLHCMDLTIEEFYSFRKEIHEAIDMMTSN